MGCADSRDKRHEEEDTLAVFENALKFNRQLTTSIDFGFRKYSYEGEISASQFAEACDKLHLQRVNTDQYPNIEAFYNKLRNENGKLILKKLLLLGVLLGKGTPHEKAQILFEIYDDTDAHVLEGLTVKQMVDDMFDMSVNLLPTLVPANCRGHDSQKVKYYIDRILYRCNKSKDMLRMALTEGAVRTRRDAFVGTLWKEERKQLLTAAGIREFCFKYWQSTPSSWHLATIAKSNDNVNTEAQKA
mmetsp:Transcript_23467/g.41606  ORF Transcript_23467/g.41606 Transcript_23467/m.41606 type:complete len:245 (-) Transcript_23467:827-1561(-)|eukprot:CAMPEP_0204905210 /NCGR_PEP_ID=MMETSP1397-20131031/5300_1 /ASSEMBLY_ACC=CAM_ASM_000891 /TAXON_ID=49980 /ORGANISM="Climacostomum Climacostomum virens, Strain Stock W-24" /LENGTH=244 /DNA_ID=CAMNT_0052074079 /DNA_START=36 /DNA_END=770 /DNA_ORIENTATION=-